MRLPINKVAHGIGMQNQYLGHAVYDGKVVGEVVDGGDYHSNKSWVDLDSVEQYIQWRFDNFVIGKETLDKAMNFIRVLKETIKD